MRKLKDTYPKLERDILNRSLWISTGYNAMWPVKVAVIGPEASGKSILASALAHYFSCPLCADYCSFFLDRHDGDVTPGHILQIAQMKIEAESLLNKEKPRLLISDNELLSLKIWSEYRFSTYSQELKSKVDTQYFDLYLLTKPEVYIKKLRREDPKLRNYFLNAYKKELEENSLPYLLLEGEFYLRKKAAVAAIEKLLQPQFIPWT